MAVGENKVAADRGLISCRLWQSSNYVCASVCECVCVCSDLHWALFDLVAARGVESRGLLEEELSGCLEGLRERIGDDQTFIVHAQSYSAVFSVLSNSKKSRTFKVMLNIYKKKKRKKPNVCSFISPCTHSVWACTLSVPALFSKSDFLNLRYAPGWQPAWVFISVGVSEFFLNSFKTSSWLKKKSLTVSSAHSLFFTDALSFPPSVHFLSPPQGKV